MRTRTSWANGRKLTSCFLCFSISFKARLVGEQDLLVNKKTVRLGRLGQMFSCKHDVKQNVTKLKAVNLNNQHNYQMCDGSHGFAESDWHIWYRNCALIIKHSSALTPSLERPSRLAPKNVPGWVSAEYRSMAVNAEGILWTDHDGCNFHIGANSSIPCKFIRVGFEFNQSLTYFQDSLKYLISVFREWKFPSM